MSLTTTLETTPAASSPSIALEPIGPALNSSTDAQAGYRVENEPLTISSAPPTTYLGKGRSTLVVVQLALLSMMTSFTTGLITTSIPTMSVDLSIPSATTYWPLSVYGLTCGSCVLLAGAIADILGPRKVYLVGNLGLVGFVLGCGLAQTDIQLIMFRAMQGIAVSLCLPTSVSILTKAVEPGRRRNLGFAFLGLSQTVGYSIGLVFAGIFIQTVGWRIGWYIMASIIFSLLLIGMYVLPPDDSALRDSKLRALGTKLDWVGLVIGSGSLALFSYSLVQISGSDDLADDKSAIISLAVSVAAMPAFAWWMSFAAKRGWPVLIPNTVWKQTVFVSACLMVLLSYAAMQAMELYCTLFFQNVQRLDALQSSIRMLPAMVVGTSLSLTLGFFLHRMTPMYLVVTSSLLCAVAPLLMAVTSPAWPYWYAAFPAQMLQPMSADVLYTVGIIAISEVFPDDMQALAGAVFNTMGQFGTSIGLAVIGVIADKVTQSSAYVDKTAAEALLMSYRAAFWAAFACLIFTCVVAVIGLRKVGKVGLKRE